jgi:hypothetical protein
VKRKCEERMKMGEERDRVRFIKEGSREAYKRSGQRNERSM